MMLITRTETIEINEYISDDGKVFDTKERCLKHEWNNKATIIYAIHKRGSRNISEAYSTEELAYKAIENTDNMCDVVPVSLDERFWNE